MTSTISPASRRLAVLFAAATLVIGAEARAEQFLLFQQTFEITKAAVDRSGSHFYVRGAALTNPPGNNWLSPVDYRNGTVHIRTEVLEKPASGEPNHWSYCYMPNRPIGPGYGCAGSGVYRDKGIYDRVEKMTAWWQNTAISWPQGIKEMHLVIKGMGDSGHLHKRSDVDKLFPSKVRITMVQVSAGGTFDPSKVPGWGPVDSPATDAAPAPAADAGAPTDPTPPGTGGAPAPEPTPGTGGAPPSPPNTGGATSPPPLPPSSSTGGASAAPTGTGGATAPPTPAGNDTIAGGCTLAGRADRSSAVLASALALLALALSTRRRR